MTSIEWLRALCLWVFIFSLWCAGLDWYVHDKSWRVWLWKLAFTFIGLAGYIWTWYVKPFGT